VVKAGRSFKIQLLKELEQLPMEYNKKMQRTPKAAPLILTLCFDK